jgi:hypothetical protein
MALPIRLREKTDEQKRNIVINGTIAGLTAEQIAEILSISKETIWNHYKKELQFAAQEANAMVVGSLYRNCIAGNVAAQIFWCKTRLNWRETSTVEVNHLQRAVISDKELSKEDWDAEYEVKDPEQF